jgi:hypothetical protein
VHYSFPGAGDGSNSRLNAEYAVIRKTAAYNLDKFGVREQQR